MILTPRKPFERELLLRAISVSGPALEGWVIDRLTAITEEHRIRQGDVLWKAGKPLDWLYFMRDGHVRLTRPGARPWTFEGSWFLGSFEARRGDVIQHDAIALSDFYALRLPPRSWFALLEDSFALTRAAVTAAANAVAALEERLPPEVFRHPGLAQTPHWRQPLGVLGRLALLAELPVARGAGVQALADLAAASEEVTLTEGESLLGAGAKRDALLVVASGTIQGRSGPSALPRRFEAGDVVAGPAAFTDRVAAWEAHAATQAHVLSVPVEAWFDLMEDHFDLVQSFLGVLKTWRERALRSLADAAGPDGIVLR